MNKLTALLIRNKKILLVCIFLFLLAFIIRWFTLPQLLFFGFEQGRDAKVVGDIITLEKFTLVGPKTDITGIFNGPWYYYILSIPYGITGGNPLSAAFFIALVNSFVPLIIFFLAKDIFNSFKWGIVAGVLTIFSHEYILYSRWISNPSLSPLLVSLCFYFLWLFRTRRKGIYFIASAVCAALSAQMGIAQTWIFVFAYLAILILKVIPFPSIKTLSLAFLASFIIFSPLVIFDFRHDHITWHKVVEYVQGGDTEISLKPSFSDSINGYYKVMNTLVERSIFNYEHVLLQIFLLVIIIAGIGLFIKHKGNIKIVLFVLIWAFMSLGVLIFSVNLDQIYVGVGLGWILLLTIALKGLWEQKLGKLVVVFVGILIVYSWFINLNNLYTNTGANKTVFFITSQVGLNLNDQRRMIDYLHQDIGSDPYRFEAFTLPYLHPEGWHYLNEHYYKDKKPTPGAKTIYIAIEQNVAPFWEKKWIEDYGKTNLIWEKTFGLLRLQKREVLD